MNALLLSAIAAAVAHAAAAYTRRRAVSTVALLVALVALALRLPTVGAAVTGLAAAVGLACAALIGQRWRLHWFACAVSIPAAVFAAAPMTGGWLTWASSVGAVAMFVAASAIAAQTAMTGDRDLRTALALVLVVAPAPLLMASPMAASAEWPLGVHPAASVVHTTTLLVTTDVADWAVWMWRVSPWLGFVAVALNWAVGRRALLPAFGVMLLWLLIAAYGSWPAVAAWLAGTEGAVIVDPRHFPLAAPVTDVARQVDGSAGLLMVVRWFIAAALLATTGGNPVQTSKNPAALDAVVVAVGLFLIGLWTLAATGFIGPYWLVDPVAMATFAATIVSIALLHWRRGLSATVLRAIQLVACGLLLGGGDLGWRVASALLVG